MPIACLFAHDPDPRTALVLDSAVFASCRRCGAGLSDGGEGWATPLSWREVLARPRRAPETLVPARLRARCAPDY